IDYSSVRRMPTVKLSGQTQGTTTNTMPASSSLQDISSHTHKFNWNKDQPLINLNESLLTSKNRTNDRQKSFSQSNDHIFEHPEVIIKPTTLDDKIPRRLTTTTTRPFNTNENGTGSAPNILEHPDIKTPIVMENYQKSLFSSPVSSISSINKKLTRQQSADAYTTRERTISPVNYNTNQINLVTNPIRSGSPVSSIDDIVERPEQEKSEDTSSSTPPLVSKGSTKIIREYDETSSTSDVDSPDKHSNNHNNNHHKPQSEEDDFW
ncbi:unnamed protein product, partial [Rotaria sordida]